MDYFEGELALVKCNCPQFSSTKKNIFFTLNNNFLQSMQSNLSKRIPPILEQPYHEIQRLDMAEIVQKRNFPPCNRNGSFGVVLVKT